MKQVIYLIFISLIAAQGISLEAMTAFRRLASKLKIGSTIARQQPRSQHHRQPRQQTRQLQSKISPGGTLWQKMIRPVSRQHTTPAIKKMFVQQRRSYLELKDIVGLDMAINKVCSSQKSKGLFSPYSPTLGAAYLETDFLKKLYVYGDPQLATVQLLRNVFYMQGSDFYATRNKSLPAFSLTPELLGKLINLITHNTTTKEFDFNSKEGQEFIEQWSLEHTRLSASNKTKKIKDFICLFQKSIKECSPQNPHAPFSWHMPYAILFSFLWAKATNQNYIIEYVANAMKNSEWTSEESKTYLNQLFEYNHHRETLFDPFASNIQLWSENFEARYRGVCINPHAGLFRKIQINIPTHMNNLSIILDDIDILSTNLHIRSQSPVPLPPKLITARYTGTSLGYTFSLCAEQSIKNLFNLLLANSESKQFDFDLLPIKPHKDLINFYKQFPIWESANQEASNMWAELLSGHSFLDYVFKNAKKKCELRSQEDNLFKLFTYFFNLQATSWQALGPLLSTNDRKIAFTKIIKENHTEIEMKISNNQISVVIGIVDFSPGHTKYSQKIFSLKRNEKQYEKQYVDNYYDPGTKEELLQSFSQNGLDSATAGALLPFFDCHKLKINTSCPCFTHMHSWYARDLDNPRVLHDTILEALSIAKNNPQIHGTLKHWISVYPKDAPAKLIKDAIIKSELHVQNSWFAEYVSKLEQNIN